ncbi:MAG: biotin/lipoyl-binding protein [Alphaproteobacteria bacterium]|nr:biotin/lipoyl-binding protein [Alphaproteobacteria bacterium]
MTTEAQAEPLATLREDLTLRPGAPAKNGEPRWLIYDPVRHRYFEIAQPAFELLSVWPAPSRDEFKERFEEKFLRSPCDTQIDELQHFIHSNSLTQTPPGGDSRAFLEQSQRTRRSVFMQGVQGYLFIRFPLVRPSRFLTATLPIVAPLFSRLAAWIILTVGLIGIYLVSRQWDAFTHTFLHFFSTEGAIYYGVSLILIKTLHELAHAYTATRYGVRVPTMGVALMVMFPVLYTDVTDAWRLRSRRQQLEIAAAGIVMELAIACLATFAWAVLPEGPAKSVAFTLATSSWILSLAINLNPLMRFDGYYLLADFWGISNLQSRSFAIGRWWLREALFDLKHPPPDRFDARTRRLLAAYAFATWIYRFFLFLGIALLVYHIFFKALGIVLFLVEIAYFIALPIMREFTCWWTIKDEIMQTRRTAYTALTIAFLIGLAAIPVSRTVVIPATLEAEAANSVFAPAPGRIKDVFIHDSEPVRKNQILAQLESPELLHQLRLTERKIELVKARIARIASGEKERFNSTVLHHELSALQEKHDGLDREVARLTLRAPSDGHIRDLNQLVHVGRWLKSDELIARIVKGGDNRLRGILGEDDLWRLEPGASGIFIPDDPSMSSLAVSLDAINTAGENTLENDYLASTFGGPIPVEKTSDGKLKPVNGIHSASFSPRNSNLPVAGRKVLRGVIHLTGKPESLAAAAWRQVMRILVRESSL